MSGNEVVACPCQSGRTYAACCAPLHRGEAIAETAEILMRSRYSAYARGDAGYLLATWHESTRPSTLDLGDAVATRWLGLEVRRHEQHDADRATVEFIARYKVGGTPAVRLHEISRFTREDGRWFWTASFPCAEVRWGVRKRSVRVRTARTLDVRMLAVSIPGQKKARLAAAPGLPNSTLRRSGERQKGVT